MYSAERDRGNFKPHPSSTEGKPEVIVIDSDDKETREMRERRADELASNALRRLATFGVATPSSSSGKLYLRFIFIIADVAVTSVSPGA